MRHIAILTIILLCGCLEAQKEIQREYVCPNGAVVDSPGKCPVLEPTTTSVPTTTTSTIPVASTSSTQSTTTTTNPDPCAALSKNKNATCQALLARNASLCPFPGLEHSDELLTDSLFMALGQDIFSREKKNVIMDAFTHNKTCVMALIGLMGSKSECDAFQYGQLCREKFIVDANDTKLCDALIQGPMQQGCYYALISLSNNPRACIKYPEYDQCLVKMAALTDDYAPCRQVYLSQSKEGLVAECISDAKLMRCLQSNDNTVDCCAKLPNDMMSGCYASKLKRTNDTLWCKRRLSEGEYESDWSCFSAIAKEMRDTRICDEIISKDWHDECYRDIIDLSGNRTQCSRIRDDKRRHDCVWNLT